MKIQKIRIAVSGAGGGVGQSIIKSLYDSDYDIIALDSEPLGTGLYATSQSYLIPYANDPMFIDKLLEICQKENIKIYFPGLDAELPFLSINKDRFENIGTKVVVSSPEVVELSDNKMMTYSVLSKYGILVPKTIDMAQYDCDTPPLLETPYILKRKVGGHRSIDVYKICSHKELQKLIAGGLDLKGFVAQEYIEGDEYTCGTVNLESKCWGVIVMRRVLRNGDTYQCFSEKNKTIENEVIKIMNSIKPFGACNVQLRIKDMKVYVLEINARCSGTTAARSLCGFNEPKMIADFLCFNKKPTFNIKEQTILRYWKELIIENELINKMRQDGSIKVQSYKKL